MIVTNLYLEFNGVYLLPFNFSGRYLNDYKQKASLIRKAFMR